MPEIAEREPKVISVWSVLFGCFYLEVLVRTVQAQRGRGPGDSLYCTALVCARAEEMVLFTPS